MKIGILTFHNAHNYGASLQAYALKTCVEQMGHEVAVINYRNPKIEGQYPKQLRPKITKKVLNPKNWKQFLYDTIRGIYGQKAWSGQWEAFDRFITQKLLENETRLIHPEDFAGLGKDAYLLGSDQIWSSFLTGTLDPVYFGKFKKNERIISYAASLANGKIAENEENAFQELLKNVDGISVREEKLADQLRKITGREVATGVDPTLLLEERDYLDLMTTEKRLPDGKLPTEEKYVFAYFVVEEKAVEECAKKVAKKMGLQLIELHYYHMPEISEKNQFADFGPGDFLAYIKNAEIVITNSFHGTVFSILFGKPFYSVYKKNGRVDNLLDFLEIPERHVSGAEEIEKLDEIDYEKVHKKLAEYRESSLRFLRENLK